MRPRSRTPRVLPRRVLPERSRLTLGRTVAALRRSREALVDLESQLGDLLIRVRSPGVSLDSTATDRLAVARRQAAAAMASLNQLGQHFG